MTYPARTVADREANAKRMGLTVEFQQTLKSLRDDLWVHCYAELGEWPNDRLQAMFDEAQWTGYLNRIDPLSPHCVTTEAEAQSWHDEALKYLDSYLERVTAPT